MAKPIPRRHRGSGLSRLPAILASVALAVCAACAGHGAGAHRHGASHGDGPVAAAHGVAGHAIGGHAIGGHAIGGHGAGVHDRVAEGAHPVPAVTDAPGGEHGEAHGDAFGAAPCPWCGLVPASPAAPRAVSRAESGPGGAGTGPAHRDRPPFPPPRGLPV